MVLAVAGKGIKLSFILLNGVNKSVPTCLVLEALTRSESLGVAGSHRWPLGYIDIAISD